MGAVFIAGATGYVGRRLGAELAGRGHVVQALVRAGSEAKVPNSCEPVTGNALDSATYAGRVAAGASFVHLVGTPHPAPWKHAQFRAVDLVSLRQSVLAATHARVAHFVFVSVAHPAPVMRSYIAVRMECERILGESGLAHTVLRPWYVLGPGHRWPVALMPLYWMAERGSRFREGALRLGLVTLDQMVAALAWAVENSAAGVRVIDVPGIRAIAAGGGSAGAAGPNRQGPGPPASSGPAATARASAPGGVGAPSERPSG